MNHRDAHSDRSPKGILLINAATQIVALRQNWSVPGMGG
jgi:hypothetical protein